MPPSSGEAGLGGGAPGRAPLESTKETALESSQANHFEVNRRLLELEERLDATEYQMKRDRAKERL